MDQMMSIIVVIRFDTSTEKLLILNSYIFFLLPFPQVYSFRQVATIGTHEAG